MGRFAKAAKSTTPTCLKLKPPRPSRPSRTRRDPPARPSSSTSLPTTRLRLTRLPSVSSSPSGRWSLPRRLLPLPLLARRELEASSCPPRSPRPRSPLPRRPRSPRLPPRRSKFLPSPPKPKPNGLFQGQPNITQREYPLPHIISSKTCQYAVDQVQHEIISHCNVHNF